MRHSVLTSCGLEIIQWQIDKAGQEHLGAEKSGSSHEEPGRSLGAGTKSGEGSGSRKEDLGSSKKESLSSLEVRKSLLAVRKSLEELVLGCFNPERNLRWYFFISLWPSMPKAADADVFPSFMIWYITDKGCIYSARGDRGRSSPHHPQCVFILQEILPQDVLQLYLQKENRI